MEIHIHSMSDSLQIPSVVIDKQREEGRNIGLPKSGRSWKRRETSKSSGQIAVKQIRSSWARKTELRKHSSLLKEKIMSMRSEQDAERAEKRRRTQQKRKQREENRKKSEVTQIITNPSTLKKMSKKQIRMLRKT